VIPSNQHSPSTHRAGLLWRASFGLLILVIVVFSSLQSIGFANLLQGNGIFLALLIVVLAGTSLYLYLRLQKSEAEFPVFQKQYLEAEGVASLANQRLSSVLRLSQKLVDASDEKGAVQHVLQFVCEMFGATAASFVPLDERRQPLAAINYGDVPGSMMNAWIEYLASPSVRQRCETCEKHGLLTQTCPLLEVPLGEEATISKPVEIYCLPLRRGDREFGILNLYLPAGHKLDVDDQMFLRAMLDETSLVLEGVRLRRREITALSQLQAASQKNDLNALLSNFLEHVRETLKADFAYLNLVGQDRGETEAQLVRGQIPGQAEPLIKALVQGILISRKPMLLGDLEGMPDSVFLDLPLDKPFLEQTAVLNTRALLLAPLTPQEGPALGAVILGSERPNGFNSRQLALLQSLASQVALVVQNSRLMAEIEYRTMMGERSRLAREIHDGLAQTLGFLKLQTSQMQNYLHLKDWERLAESIRISHKILEEAYLDARQAIDGLRILPAIEGLSPWLEQTVIEFQENSGIQVDLIEAEDVDHLASEVQAQLIRIVQEALSNVRKHARAKQVWVVCRIDAGDLVLEVRDDGCGFSPEDVPTSSRYGLQGMRERTELIGAEFQVISRPKQGTTVRVRLPLSIGETPV
jgi:two-component system, NarL family, nitrate/nitrite sensor histidine kinase NarX